MKTKKLMSMLLFLNLSIIFTHETSVASNLNTLQERLAFVDLGSIQETQATQDLYDSLEIIQSSEPLLACFSYLKNLALSHAEERQNMPLYAEFSKIKTSFDEGKLPSVENANSFFCALNYFETAESIQESSYSDLKNEERGYFYTYVGVLKLFFKEIETATNYLLEARQLLLRQKPFNSHRWEAKSAEDFFFNNVIQPYFNNLSIKSLNPSLSEQKLWLHFSHLNDREYRCASQFEMAQSMANTILQSTHSLEHFSDIELFTKIQNIIRLKDKTREGPIPTQDLKMYIKIVEQVTSFHPFPKLFIYRHPMTLLQGILLLQNTVAKLSQKNLSTQDEETRYLVDQIGPLNDLQHAWASKTISFYVNETTRSQYNEFLIMSNLSQAEIDRLKQTLSIAASHYQLENSVNIEEALPKIYRLAQRTQSLDFIFSHIAEIFKRQRNDI
ncbi:MAG: hypothetical protein C0432_02415 [Candidatus Puniceispirillum sp.]|nr:hypothetical protein [Candidatus Pelagibacter sp.]MBA4283129.1 hypothetical protein [Candidatus Puniceispirillum sp.]